jgi:hypothetical protein
LLRHVKVTCLLDPFENGTRLTAHKDGFGEVVEIGYEQAVGWERYLGRLGEYFDKM